MHTLPLAMLAALFTSQLAVGSESPQTLPRLAPETDRFPGEHWLQYVDVREAGFSPQELAGAKSFWERRDSSAFLVVSGGAVVAAWGDVERRFMCHSIRKSILSALYGVYRDQIDLQLTLDELEIDDEPPLTDHEKRARIIDLISSRSGIYHDAASESAAMTRDRPERGSHQPGTHWWYNNWDFNTAGVVFEQITDESIFDALDRRIAQPIGMQDYRRTDGFYQLEEDRSVHPAYPLRMSTRDLARFGLLFARGGRWQDQQVIPRDWVEESTQPHSKTNMGSNYGPGYGYMWWIEESRGFTARGSGGHILAVHPDRDLVMVIRADTYHDRSVSTRACMRLLATVADAGHGERATAPRLIPMHSHGARLEPPSVSPDRELSQFVCRKKMESGRSIAVTMANDVLSLDSGEGVFRLHSQGDARFTAEDSADPVLFEFGDDGQVSNVWTEQLCYLEAAAASKRGDFDSVLSWVNHAAEKFPDSSRAHLNLARALHGLGQSDAALPHLHRALEIDPTNRHAQALLRNLNIRRLAWIPALAVIGVGALLFVRRSRKKRRNSERESSRESQDLL